MRNIILILALLISFSATANAAVIGNLGTVTTIDLDGVSYVHPEPSRGILKLYTGCQANTNDCTFRVANGTAGYTPASGLKFVALTLTAMVDSAATAQIILVTSSNDCGVIGTTDATVVTSFYGTEAAFYTILGTNGGKQLFSIEGFELTNTSTDFFTMRNIASARGSYVITGYETAE